MPTGPGVRGLGRGRQELPGDARFLYEAVRTRPALLSLVLQVRAGHSSSGYSAPIRRTDVSIVAGGMLPGHQLGELFIVTVVVRGKY